MLNNLIGAIDRFLTWLSSSLFPEPHPRRRTTSGPRCIGGCI